MYPCILRTHADTDCDGLNDPEGGTVDLMSYPNFALYSCDDGLVLVGSSMRECITTYSGSQAVHVWQGDAPTCQGGYIIIYYIYPVLCIKNTPQQNKTNFF